MFQNIRFQLIIMLHAKNIINKLELNKTKRDQRLKRQFAIETIPKTTTTIT